MPGSSCRSSVDKRMCRRSRTSCWTTSLILLHAISDGAIGVAATGTLDAATVNSLLRNLPPGTWELVTHPGYNEIDLARAHTRLLAARETELQALRALQRLPDLDLISFADL